MKRCILLVLSALTFVTLVSVGVLLALAKQRELDVLSAQGEATILSKKSQTTRVPGVDEPQYKPLVRY